MTETNWVCRFKETVVTYTEKDKSTTRSHKRDQRIKFTTPWVGRSGRRRGIQETSRVMKYTRVRRNVYG